MAGNTADLICSLQQIQSAIDGIKAVGEYSAEKAVVLDDLEARRSNLVDAIKRSLIGAPPPPPPGPPGCKYDTEETVPGPPVKKANVTYYRGAPVETDRPPAVQTFIPAGAAPCTPPYPPAGFKPTSEYFGKCIDAAAYVIASDTGNGASSGPACVVPVPIESSDDEMGERVGSTNGASGSGGAPPSAVTFDGAASAAQEVEKASWCCADCEFATTSISRVAYLLPDNSFVKHVDKKVHDAMSVARGGELSKWKNGFENLSASRLVCIGCCERLHSKQYRNKETGKPTSEWDRLRKASMLMNLNKSRAGFVLRETDAIMQQKSKGTAVNSADLYDKLAKSEALKRGRDWVTDMGPLAVLLYGCPCGRYPTKNGCWYKCIKNGTIMIEGMTSNGDGTGGFWMCAVCKLRWNWTYGHLRLFVIGTVQSIQEGRYWFRHVGNNVDSAAEAKILYIKGIRMLQELGGRPVTVENILDCIEALNNAAEVKLLRGVKEICTVRSADVTDRGVQIYNEHPALSIPASGRWFKAIDLSDAPQAPAFDAKTLREVLIALTEAPGQVIIATTTMPAGRLPKGWTLVQTGATE